MQFLITEYKMARSIQQIKQDLEIIEAKTLEVGGELQDLYNKVNLVNRQGKIALFLTLLKKKFSTKIFQDKITH